MPKKGSINPADKVRAVFGGKVAAKPLKEPKDEEAGVDVEDLLTRVCYFYPQYTLEEADRLTFDQVSALLMQAEKQRAIEFYNHTLISAGPHSKKGKLVSKLVKQYRKIINL